MHQTIQAILPAVSRSRCKATEIRSHSPLRLHRRKQWLQARPFLVRGSLCGGLSVFDARHRALFFGRAQACGELVHALQAVRRKAVAATRFVVVQGVSGVGQSSLLQADMLPLLEGRAIAGIAAWRHAIVQPPSVDGAWDPDRAFMALVVPEAGR